MVYPYRFSSQSEELMEVELIDFPKVGSGIGAFLTPASDGLGARVERLAPGEMAERVSSNLHSC